MRNLLSTFVIQASKFCSISTDISTIPHKANAMDVKNASDGTIAVEVTSLEDCKLNQRNQIAPDHRARSSLRYTRTETISSQQRTNWRTIFGKSMEFDAGGSTSIDRFSVSETIKDTCRDSKDMLCKALQSQEIPNDESINVTSDDLRQFDVLDDLDRHPEQNDDSDGDDSDTDESMDSDVPDEEIEAMLEEGKLKKD